MQRFLPPQFRHTQLWQLMASPLTNAPCHPLQFDGCGFQSDAGGSAR